MALVPDQPFAKLPRGLAPLGYRNFFLFWIAFATSNSGRWLELTGSLWIVYEITSSPLLVGLIGVARAVPGFLLSPIAGVVADRIDQRGLLIGTQVFSILISLSIGALVFAGAVQLWQVYLAIFLQSALWAFDAAGRQAFFPRLVSRANLPNAVTLFVTAGRVAKFLGPVIAGFAIAGIGESAPFLLNATTFAVLIPALLLIRGVPRHVAQVSATFARDLTEGIRQILFSPALAGLFKMEVVFGLFEMNAVMIAIIARERLGVGPEAMGLLLSAPALGSFVGIAWLVTMGHARRQGRFSLVSVLAYSVVLLFVAFSTTYSVTFIALALVGALDSLATITRNSILQLAAPPAMRGRVMSSMGLVTRGLSPLAETQSGLLASFLGPTYTLIGSAVALALAAGITIRTNPALWAFSSKEEPEAPPSDRA